MAESPDINMYDRYEYEEVENALLQSTSSAIRYIAQNTSLQYSDLVSSNSSVCSDDLIDRASTICSDDLEIHDLENIPTESYEDYTFEDNPIYSNSHYTLLPLSCMSRLRDNEETASEPYCSTTNLTSTYYSTSSDTDSDTDETFTVPVYRSPPMEHSTYAERVTTSVTTQTHYEENISYPNFTHDIEEEDENSDSSENDSDTENPLRRNYMYNTLTFNVASRRYVSQHRIFKMENKPDCDLP